MMVMRPEPTFWRGFYAIWEEGGKFSESGRAIIVANADGSKPKAVVIEEQPKPCGKHALIVLEDGMWIIMHEWDMFITQTNVWRAKWMSDGTFDYTLYEHHKLPSRLQAAINAAHKKARMRRCKKAVWVEV